MSIGLPPQHVKRQSQAPAYQRGVVKPIFKTMDYAAHAWLFVRGEESIRMTTKPTGGTLLIFGPGEANQSHNFVDAASLRTFLESYQERLLSDGWVLAIVAERRQPDRETAPFHERRAQERRSKKPV